MRALRTMVLVTAVMLTGALTVKGVSAQDSKERAIEQYTCKDVMREAGSNRDVAVAFLHGFLLGKSGGSKFAVETLQKQSDAFMDRCLDNPNEKAVDAMMKVKS